nr:gliding motility-associated C-terminal domain-containing protein [Bacteroidota bacterium]
SYSWAPAGGNTSTATGLGGGTYTVTITDAYGCIKTTSATVATSTALLTPSISSNVPVTCTGSSTGSLTVTQTGGTAPYSYSWTPAGGNSSTATGLGGGTYTVTITDAYGCIKTTSATVATSTALLTPSISSNVPVTCTGSSTGSLTATQTGGTAPYSYSWAPAGGNTSTATGLGGGTYTVTITDAYGCIKTTSATVATSTALLTPTISSNVPVDCTGNFTGSLTASQTGGTAPYSYSWVPVGGNTSTATGLSGGTYTVTITDAYGCIKTTSAKVLESPEILTPFISSTQHINCFGNSTGSLTASQTGGTASYTYLWAPSGSTNDTISGLGVGTYTVTITDLYGCVKTTTGAITQPSAALSVVSGTTKASCSGSNGTASVTAFGGTPGFTYKWSNGGQTKSITGLSAGSYTVIVTDTNGCTRNAVAIITDLPGPTAGVSSQTNITCNGLKNGSATTSVTSGGSAPFTYIWNPNVTNNNSATGLSAGTYTVVVRDVNGCKDTVMFTIIEPLPITFSLTTSNSTVCAGQPLTLLTSTPTGGRPPFTYSWSPNGPVVSPLVPTTYSVTVTDSSGCISVVDTIRVTPLPTPVADFDTLRDGKFHQKYAFIDKSTGAVTWYWNFGDGKNSNSQNPSHLFPGAGAYTVTQIVTRSNGCTDTITKVIIIHPSIIFPNVFTPNKDGINDEFWIPNTGFEYFQLDIYDRWGLKIFTANSGEIRWDGRTAAGEYVPDGTYYYMLQGKLKTETGGKEYNTRGFVNLLK